MTALSFVALPSHGQLFPSCTTSKNRIHGSSKDVQKGRIFGLAIVLLLAQHCRLWQRSHQANPYSKHIRFWPWIKPRTLISPRLKAPTSLPRPRLPVKNGRVPAAALFRSFSQTPSLPLSTVTITSWRHLSFLKRASMNAQPWDKTDLPEKSETKRTNVANRSRVQTTIRTNDDIVKSQNTEETFEQAAIQVNYS